MQQGLRIIFSGGRQAGWGESLLQLRKRAVVVIALTTPLGQAVSLGLPSLHTLLFLPVPLVGRNTPLPPPEKAG